VFGVHQELDGVSSSPAAMTVAGEDVVLEYERMRTVHDRAEDFFHLAVVLDRLDHPAASLVALGRVPESVPMGRDEEELLQQVAAHECEPVHRPGVADFSVGTLDPGETGPQVFPDAVGADTDAGAQVTDELEVFAP
jgi:hypothetical protein